MTAITFFPLGNADTTKIDFSDDRKMLIDYCHVKDAEDESDKRIDLAATLREELGSLNRTFFDIVAFTHADDDHVHGASDFFSFEFTPKYQDTKRIKINELWVPSIMVTSANPPNEDARVIRQEARYRMKRGEGIRVFGQPQSLDDWLKSENIDPQSRRNLISTAGQIVPGFSQTEGNVEIFVHSPFAFRLESDEEDRNNNSLILHVTFFPLNNSIKCFLGGDSEHENWENLIFITEDKGNEDRLEWDVFKISHHCSYLALGPEKGKDITKPSKIITKLFNRGQSKCILVSTSDPIPQKDTKNPPHLQAAEYYRNIACGNNRDGDFVVTMAHPSQNDPQPLIIEITEYGALLKKVFESGPTPIVASPAPRGGNMI